MIEVYRIDADHEQLWSDDSVLDERERLRAASIVRPEQRRQWIRSRVAQRHILAKKLMIKPGQVRFAHGSIKPAVETSGSEDAVEFNLSRSGRFAYLAISSKSRVGIDVERKRAVRNRDAKTARFFCRCEQQQLQALPESERDLGFLQIWTAKEAWLKALGIGIQSFPITQVCVSLDPIARYESSERFANHQVVPSFIEDEGHVCCVAFESNFDSNECIVRRL